MTNISSELTPLSHFKCRKLLIEAHAFSAKVKPTKDLCGHLNHATSSSSSFALRVVQVHASDTHVNFCTIFYNHLLEDLLS